MKPKKMQQIDMVPVSVLCSKKFFQNAYLNSVLPK